MISILGCSEKKVQEGEYSENIHNHPFGSISENYTLVLTGYFDDCGEFGGHIERIELLRIDGEFRAIVTIFDKSCQDTNYSEPGIIETESYFIEESKLYYFQEYLNKLLAKSLEDYIGFHAGRHYRANLAFRKGDEESEEHYSFQRISLAYHDTGRTWTEFQKLKSIVEK